MSYLCGMKEYWYLREGDFLPEEIDTLCRNWKCSRSSIVEFLSNCGNIFENKEEAEEVSMKVREVLLVHQLHQGHLSRIHIHVDTPGCGEW